MKEKTEWPLIAGKRVVDIVVLCVFLFLGIEGGEASVFPVLYVINCFSVDVSLPVFGFLGFVLLV